MCVQDGNQLCPELSVLFFISIYAFLFCLPYVLHNLLIFFPFCPHVASTQTRYSMSQNIQYWNEKTNNIVLLSSVSLFLLKETNIHTISVLIYFLFTTGNTCGWSYAPSTNAHARSVYFGAYCICFFVFLFCFVLIESWFINRSLILVRKFFHFHTVKFM
jgi:hypothetical protein